MTEGRATLQDRLLAAGKPVDVKVPCARCSRICWPVELVDVRDTPDIDEDDICTNCLAGYDREQVAKAEAEAAAGVQGWDTDTGAECRAERNRRLDACLWAVQPGSPLTPECQDEFCEYRKALNRVTVDFGIPADVVWPDQPTLVYD